MIFYSIDIETTGLDPESDHIIEVALVREDTDIKMNIDELPYLRALIHSAYWNFSTMSDKVYEMHRKLIEEIDQREPLYSIHIECLQHDSDICIRQGDLSTAIGIWLDNFGDNRSDVLFAGKNAAGFDWPFIMHHCRRLGTPLPLGMENMISPRCIDPTLFYVDFNKDRRLIGSNELARRSRVPNTNAHSALSDARWIIEIMRKHY